MRIPPHVNPRPLIFSEPAQSLLKSGEYECERCMAPVPTDGYLWNQGIRAKTCISCMTAMDVRSKKNLRGAGKQRQAEAMERGSE